MRKSLIAVFAMAALAGAVSAANDAKDPKIAASPRIQFDKVVYDFGQTSMVQSLTGTFTFQNVGDGVLEVRRPSSSCGCTVAAVKPDKVEQNQKGELVFTLNVTGMNRGKVEKQITVPTNDAHTPAVQLTVKTELVSSYDVAPAEVGFGDLRVGAATKIPVIVKRVDGKPLQIASAKSSSEMVQTRVEPLADYAGTAARVWVEITGQGDLRRVSENVVLVGEEAAQIALISVTGRVVGDITVAPESIFWGISDPASWPGAFPDLMTKRRLRVVLTQPGKPLELSNPTTTLPDLQLSVATVETGKVFEVIAQLTNAPKETVRGTITFDTNIPSQPQIVVPVLINVLKRAGS